MYSLRYQYKAETGELPFDEIEIKNETRRTHYSAIPCYDINDSYLKGKYVILPTPEYIEWLEKKAEPTLKK